MSRPTRRGGGAEAAPSQRPADAVTASAAADAKRPAGAGPDDLDPRAIRVYPPFVDEVPWQLLPKGFAAEADLDGMRVAKLNGQVVGVYAFERDSSLVYRITAFVVAKPQRRRGIGRWLLGHAIGVCETKGARELWAPPSDSRLLRRAGFEPTADGLRLVLTPD